MEQYKEMMLQEYIYIYIYAGPSSVRQDTVGVISQLTNAVI